MRKSKKIAIIILIVTIFLALPIKTFAENTVQNTTNNITNNSVNNTDNKVNENSTNNITNDIDEENLIPALEEKLKQKENKKTTIKEDEIKQEKLSEDLVIIEEDDNIEYENTYIDGNIFIISAKKVTLKNVTVNGSIFGVCKELKIDDCEIDSIYLAGDILTINEDSEINKELRFAGNKLDFSGTVKRDVYVVVKTLNIKEAAKIGKDLVVRAETSNISKKAEIEGKRDIIIADFTEIEVETTLENILWEMLTGFIIIIIASIFILGGFPKFTEINNTLKLRNFFTTFFTGILELILIFAITVGICMWGYGIGYGIALSSLAITLLGLGKIIFVVAFGVRMNAKPNNPSRVKAFLGVIFVAIIVEAINLLSLLGYTGAMIVFSINSIISISGFGSLIKVILSPRPKEKIEVNDEIKIEKNVQEDKTNTEDVQKVDTAEIKDIEINNVSINNVEIKKTEENEKEADKPKEELDNNDENK